MSVSRFTCDRLIDSAVEVEVDSFFIRSLSTLDSMVSSSFCFDASLSATTPTYDIDFLSAWLRAGGNKKKKVFFH